MSYPYSGWFFKVRVLDDRGCPGEKWFFIPCSEPYVPPTPPEADIPCVKVDATAANETINLYAGFLDVPDFPFSEFFNFTWEAWLECGGNWRFFFEHEVAGGYISASKYPFNGWDLQFFETDSGIGTPTFGVFAIDVYNDSVIPSNPVMETQGSIHGPTNGKGTFTWIGASPPVGGGYWWRITSITPLTGRVSINGGGTAAIVHSTNAVSVTPSHGATSYTIRCDLLGVGDVPTGVFDTFTVVAVPPAVDVSDYHEVVLPESFYTGKHHFALVGDGSEYRVYIDGVLLTTETRTVLSLGIENHGSMIQAYTSPSETQPPATSIGVFKMRDFRLSDMARYAGSFTPVAAGHFGLDANTLMLYTSDDEDPTKLTDVMRAANLIASPTRPCKYGIWNPAAPITPV